MQNQSLLNIYLANNSFIIIESLFSYILDILDLFSFIIISILNLVSNDIKYKQSLEEINNLKKENSNKINNKIWQRIIDISKVKLIIDINDKYKLRTNNFITKLFSLVYYY